jgi:hypothetical protein
MYLGHSLAVLDITTYVLNLPAVYVYMEAWQCFIWMESLLFMLVENAIELLLV